MIPTDDVNIRLAEEKNIGSMVQLLKSLFALEEDFQFDPPKQEKGLRLLIANKQACVLIAEYKNNIIGMCTGQTVISTAEGGPSMLVEDVVVAKEYQGNGIGKTLLNSLTTKASKSGVTRLQLLADKDNHEAISFYEHIGWKQTRLICLRTCISTKEST